MKNTPCRDCPLRKCAIFTPMSPDEVSFMETFKKGEITVDRGTPVLGEGQSSPYLYTVLRGQGIRTKMLENGRRQVVNFVFPGDFLGMQAGLMGEMKHSVEASSAMTLCIFDRAELWELFRIQPSRAYDMTWIAAVEEHILGEALATLGQRSASQRLAWVMLRIYERLAAVGLALGNSVPLPFRQQDLADALGLSLVHTNKTLARLRDRELLNWRDGRLYLSDRTGLARLAMVNLERPETRPLM